MTFNRLHILFLVAFTALVWAGFLGLQGTTPTWAHLRSFAGVVGPLALLGLALDRRLWYRRFLHGWLIKRPDLRGTWRVKLQSSYVDSKTGSPIPPIVCYMGIEQTLSTLQMHLMTPESESWLVASNIRPSRSGRGYQVAGVYTNEPKIHLRNQRISEVHRGAIFVVTHGDNLRPDRLTAEYWTDRGTNGKMDFLTRVDQVFTRFEDADRSFVTEAKS